ncbi:MarR family transcriptional regulator [Flavivirga aquimarina]|uniref:MarR family transcriptional regulator n=1 Tax=Flavivirga aquimarina TaxID=2027862 RepID=A0ABT8W5Z4_9FLAO|nr:MarR family transcriptional regulator [Flavivirga aquimarina]MDO5968525.1 MarR family transcriptional regulator [Flavivirga aquimarina]
MRFKTPTSTVLYSIEETIKAYRKLSQQNITQVVPDITLDQTLILMMIKENDKTQTEIADLIFKDYASMTRIVKLMERKGFLLKLVDNQDKRKVKLEITEKGKKVIKKLKPTVKKNRETALHEISEEEQRQLFNVLKRITKNCQ